MEVDSVSFLGVTLALTISDVIAAPDGSDCARTTPSNHKALMRNDGWRFE